MDIPPEDLKIESYDPYQGRGGQRCGKIECGITVTHRPTSTAVTYNSERSQQRNKNKAILYLEMILELEGWNDVYSKRETDIRP